MMSEQELLLLSNYAYMDVSVKDCSIHEILNQNRNVHGGFDAESVKSVRAGGGLSPEQVADLFSEMDKMPSEFKELRPTNVLNETEIRGIAYGGQGGETTVIFRGTGGTYEAWNDNVIGEYLTETKLQQRAASFVSESSGGAPVVVSGHSKGGNLAMYSTVLCPEVVSCVSFDGQGFSDEFREKYGKDISVASGKIKSISAHNDFVNILLTGIAGETVYGENEKGGVNAHSSYYLYKSNTFDERGNMTSLRSQSMGAKVLKEGADYATALMKTLPGDGRRMVANLLAAYTAAAMSDDRSAWYEQGQITGKVLGVCGYLLGITGWRKPFHQPNLRFIRHERDGSRLKEAAGTYLNISEETRRIRLRLHEMSEECERTMDSYVNYALRAVMDHLDEYGRNLSVLGSTLEEIGELYMQKENHLVTEIHSGI